MSLPIRITFFSLAVIPVALLLVGGKASRQTARPSSIERGEYLVRRGGCSDCHTPKKMTPQGIENDLSRFLSGHPGNEDLPPLPPSADPGSAGAAGQTAWSGPWGVSYASNLTPDSNTGLGIWTEEMFVKAMRTGKHYGASRDILPPMPWRALARLTDDDLRAVFAYLRSLPPIRNHVPDPLPPGGKPIFELTEINHPF